MENILMRKTKLTNVIKNVKWHEIILCVLAFTFARVSINEQYYTIGIAYLGTLYLGKELRRWGGVFTLLGFVSIGIFKNQVIPYILITILILVIRGVMEFGMYKMDLRNQCIIVVGATGVVSLIELGISGLNMYAISLVLIEMMVTGALMIILKHGVIVIYEQRKNFLTQKEAISLILIFTAIVAGMVDFYFELPLFKYIYFRDILAFLFLIIVIDLGGINVGVTVSVVVSAVLTMINYIPMSFCAIYNISSLFAGLIAPIGKVGVILGMGLGQVIGFLVFNDGQIDMILMGAYLIAGVIASILPENYFGLNAWFDEHGRLAEEKLHIERVQRIVGERLSHFVQAFNTLSHSFTKEPLKDMWLTDKQVEEIVEEAMLKTCENCSLNNICWKHDAQNTYTNAYNMVRAGEQNSRITMRDIPDKFRSNCKSAETFAYMLNFNIDLIRQQTLYENNIIETRNLMGNQLNSIAKSIEHLIDDVEEEVEFNKDAESYLRESMKAIGLSVTEIMILEVDENVKVIEMHTLPFKDEKEQLPSRVCRVITKALGVKTSCEEFLYDEYGCYFKLLPRQRFGVACGTASCAKGTLSGDVHSCMHLESGQYLMALADGMGSGEKAREESIATIEMLEEFMKAELNYELALTLINSSLLLKSNTEMFSTIDITLVDTTTGIAKILKAGASSTFVLRNNEVVTITSQSLPVGILKDIDVEHHSVQLEHGDVVIMVTDGLLSTATDVLGKEETFKSFILELQTGDPQYIADTLLAKSRRLLAGDYSDDMTIVVGRIWEKID
ncbi:MAG: hypothetical protein ATN36_03045 [Epulopiscium sp. Nele67-Bin005]|nr:MAG: hypothetical protein ATN36_03045 [Epulopiscium sp. Nele67-Bin005]